MNIFLGFYRKSIRNWWIVLILLLLFDLQMYAHFVGEFPTLYLYKRIPKSPSHNTTRPTMICINWRMRIWFLILSSPSVTDRPTDRRTDQDMKSRHEIFISIVSFTWLTLGYIWWKFIIFLCSHFFVLIRKRSVLCVINKKGERTLYCTWWCLLYCVISFKWGTFIVWE